MMLDVKSFQLQSFLPLPYEEVLAPRLKRAHEKLQSGSGAGGEFTGWVHLPRDYDREEFARIQAAAERIKKQSQVLVVVGIGGSYLGARAVIELLSSPNYNLKVKDTPDIYFAGNGLSTDALLELIALIGDRDFSVNVISKSGTTTEPAVAFRIFKGMLEQKYGKEGARERIYATTDRARGALKGLADQEGYETFVVPDAVGGRYSVLTAVGLLPIAAAGIDIAALMEGAAQAMEALAADKHPNLYVETTYPYLCLDTDSPIGAYGKMLPPIREPESRKALWDGIRSGLIDTIGTDNTVLTAGEKQVSSGMREAGAGYPTLGTHLVSVLDEGIYRQELPIEKLVPLMTMNPARIFGVYPRKGTILPGSDAGLVLVDLRAARTVDPRQLLSRSDFSLFQGRTLRGWPVAPIKGGHIAAWNGQLTDDLQRGQVLEH